MRKRSSRVPEGGSSLTHLPANETILLDNHTCPYCNTLIDEKGWTKEHVIARNFVPKGKFDGQWKLILGACTTCNRRKAELENDLSAITMQPDATGSYAHEDPTLHAEAQRKAKGAKSHRTGKLVNNSRENVTVKVSLGPLIGTMSFTAPPQPDTNRLNELACFHLMGFFYWITYDRKTKRGRLWPGEYTPIMQTARGDWGNATHTAFMNAVVTWHPRVLAVTADGFFKIAIRRHPSAVCWSWALEWNHQYRLIGFLGDRLVAQTLTASFPPLNTVTIPQGSNEYLRYRVETVLPEADDKLFDYDEPQ